MGQVRVDTPKGIYTVQIEGDAITPDELARLREGVPPPQGETFDYKVIQDPSPTPEDDNIDGEVKDLSLRYESGRMDNPEEKAGLLVKRLGAGTFEQVGEDTFAIDQAKVSPDIRKKYGLGDTGKVYLNKPGFSRYDLVDFLGESGPVTTAAIGASIAVAGMGAWPAMAIVGSTAAAVKAVDEGIEWLQGLNEQSAGQVAANIAIDGVINGVFEGAGRFVAKAIGRAFKGPGPDVSSARIAKVARETGKDTDDATKIAKAQALAEYNQMVAGGAAPTISAATGKALAARVLAINEKILPNPKIGRKNVGFIEYVLKGVKGGTIDQDQAQQLLKSEYDSIAAALDVQLADPKQIFKVIQSHLDGVVKTEMKAFERAFVPATGVPSVYVDGAKLAANLFRAESKAAYDLAEKQIGKETIFDLKTVTETIDRLKGENRFVAYTGSLFDEISAASKALTKDEGAFGLSDLMQLKQALRLSAGSPELVATPAQAGIGQIVKAVDDVIDSTFTKLSMDASRGFQLLRHPAGAVDGAGNKIGGKFYRNPLGPAENESLRQGLASWKQANAFYTEGQESINNVAVNAIIKNAQDKYYVSNIDVVSQVVKGGNAPKLRMYLKAATPSPTGAAKISKPGALETIDQIKSLIDSPNPNFKAAVDLIEASGLEDILPKLSPWVAKLPADDVFRTMHVEQYLKEMDSLSLLARAGANPQVIRESVRNGLAEVWLKGAKSTSKDQFDRFAPGKFAGEFTSLGKETQDLLFGVTNASRMRGVMEEFRAVGISKQMDNAVEGTQINNVIEAFNLLPRGSAPYPTGSIRGQVQALKEAVESAATQSKDDVARAIREGTISDPAGLVTNLLKNPNNYAKLRSAVGDDQLARVGGVQDMVMQNLVRNSFNKLDEASIQSGKWGKELQQNILAQNKNGALDQILGKDVVSQLTKVADSGVAISDAPIKGYGGLAAATGAIAVATGLVTLNIVSWGGVAATLLGVGVLSRGLRNKTVLSLMTSPRFRAKEYEAAIRAGADLPSLQALKAGGPKVYAANRIASIAASELALVAGSGDLIRKAAREAIGVPFSEVEEGMREAAQTGQSSVSTSPDSRGAGRLVPVPPRVFSESEYGALTPGATQKGGALRQMEINKLMTGRP